MSGYRGSVFKVNIGWALIVVAGIGSFALARSQVMNQRQQHIRKQKEIKKEVLAENN